jgi:hypothetical protein
MKMEIFLKKFMLKQGNMEFYKEMQVNILYN